MARSRRSLCAAADIKGWSGRPVPEQIRAQRSLVDVVHAACRYARVPEEIVQSSGDGVLLLPPSDIDEIAVIPDLISGLSAALVTENRLLADSARIRLRFSLTSGLITPGAAGFSGAAMVECFRLLDSPPVKAALDDFPAAQLAVIISDQLYREVIAGGPHGMRPAEFWSVRSELPDKGFAAQAWLYVSDRTGGPEPQTGAARAADPTDPSGLGDLAGRTGRAGPAGPAPESPREPARDVVAARDLLTRGMPKEALDMLDDLRPESTSEWLEVLDARADALLELGDHRRAQQDLEEILNLCPDPSSGPAPSALLRLGRCRYELDDSAAARHVWLFLLEHRPTTAEAYLELGRLEKRTRKYATAQNYLLEGLSVARTDATAPPNLLDDLIKELGEIPTSDL
jgi:tetratricopeptide (TPR) repeat protein